jgi:3-phenylpropionate/trans-cinnamate dioxygenase ferredoxin subunit
MLSDPIQTPGKGHDGERDFVTVGRIHEVPMDEVRAFAMGTSYVAIANIGGVFYALDDTCSHADCSLSEGELEGVRLQCVCHGSTFDATTGEVLSPPATKAVATWEVSVQGDDLRLRRRYSPSTDQD